jgi:hypothetical protein
MRRSFVLLSIFIFLLTNLTFAEYTWVKKNPTVKPSARGAQGMAYLGGSRVLMFGGTAAAPLGDTWVYDRNTNVWTQKSPATSPGPISAMAMAYIGDDKAIFFGGTSPTDTLKDETWIYDFSDNNWTQKNSGPLERSAPALAYIGDDKVLLFGGTYGTNLNYDDTWVYDLSENTWTRKFPTTKPTARSAARMSYLGDDKVVLFGGAVIGSTSITQFGDTWVYDLSDNVWTQITASPTPVQRLAHGMAETSLDGSTAPILFGGVKIDIILVNVSFELFNDTWAYRKTLNNWSQYSTFQTPSARAAHGMAYAGGGKVVLFGGGQYVNDALVYFSDTWVFEEYTPCILDGYKFNDLNGNGTLDTGEPRLSGWEIQLRDAAGVQLIKSATTNTSGAYSFSVMCGSYRISEVNKEGWIQTSPPTGYYTVTSGDHSFLNFGNMMIPDTGRFEGYKFNDINANGVWDNGEPPIQGWKIRIKNGTGTVLDSVYTDVNGKYSTLVLGSSFIVEEEHRPGFAQSLPASGTYTFEDGTYTNVNFGNFEFCSIEGYKFNDQNNNGVWDAGESGFPNWLILAKSATGTLIDTVRTDVNGYYRFELPCNSYRIEEEQKTGYNQTFPLAQSYYDLGPGDHSDINFGNYDVPEMCDIEGYKFLDENQNGVWDQTERGQSNWKIYLMDQQGVKLDSALTDLIGKYSFTVVCGAYRIGEELKSGYGQSVPGGSGYYDLDYGDHRQVNFGNYRLPCSIEGYKFEDTNGNGIWDTGEPPLAGWLITLKTLAGIIVDSVRTQANGYFHFSVKCGTYRLYEELREDYSQTLPGGVGNYYLTSGSHSDKNFGNFPEPEPCILEGYKFIDANKNGVWDTGELPKAGWAIYLKDASENLLETVLTDAEGKYQFEVPCDNYIIAEELRTNYTQTYPGGNGIYVLEPGDHANLNFGNNENPIPCTIEGYKFNDLNGNGIWDNGEPPIANWEMTLFNLSNVFIAATSTNAEGKFTFTVPCKSYRLKEEIRAGWTQTYPSGNGQYVLDPGSYTDLLFGNWQPPQMCTIDGYKFSDNNNNGIWDIEESGIGNWLIILHNPTGGLVDSVRTDAQGHYSFNVVCGSYVVSEANRSGFIQTYPSGEGTYSLGTGSHSDINFGNYEEPEPCTIEGYKFNDLDNNGIWDSGEPTIVGWMIYLLNSASEILDSVETGSTGKYIFTVDCDTYKVAEENRDGYTQTYPGNSGIWEILPGDHANINFGNYVEPTTCNLEGYKFRDENKDGIWNNGEPGLENWTIYLRYPSGELVDSVITDENGKYSFNVDCGSYRITEKLQEGWLQTYPVLNEGQWSLTPGEQSDLNFGNYEIPPQCILSGHKWGDQNSNGSWDMGEPMFSGWKIILKSSDGTLLDSMVTDQTGLYRFEVDCGEYRVAEEQRVGFIQTYPGGNGEHEVYSSSFGDLDFGNYEEMCSYSGYKFHDKNQNGIWDSNEPPLAYWKIYLADASGVAIDSVDTDDSGYYSFYVKCDTVIIREDHQTGYTQTYPGAEGVYYLVPGSYTDLNFGNYKEPCHIEGHKFNDLNQNGIWDQDEPGIPGWLILVKNAQSILIDTVRTDENGTYAFELECGNYRIVEENRDGFSQTYPGGDGRYTLEPGNYTEINFGNYEEPCRIEGFKFHDLNQNGAWDTKEPALQNWKIYLKDQSGNQLDSVFTDVAGKYYFDVLCNYYNVAEEHRENYLQTYPGGNGEYTLEPGDHSDLNFGNFLIQVDVQFIPEKPTQYKLEPAFPNPFNPVTHIRYALPELTHVRLEIYNLSGNLVEVLVDQKQEAGLYTIKWDASCYSSGIYLYRFESDRFAQINKCILMK